MMKLPKGMKNISSTTKKGAGGGKKGGKGKGC